MRRRTPAPSRPTCRSPRRHRTFLGPQNIPAPTTRFGDDDMLLLLLVSTWELWTGRQAPAVPLVEMAEAELIEYWSDPADAPRHPGHLEQRPHSEPGEPSA